jgi:thiamine-monophosphate kinase
MPTASDNAPLTIGDLGEFPLIERITARLGPAHPDTVVGAGPDDTAVLRLPNGRYQLATIDSLVAGIHFTLERFQPEDIGRKAAAINLSDIAAMGGRPTHAMASMAAPRDLPAMAALGIVDGLVGELARWGADLVGGNLTRHTGVVLDVAVLGEVSHEQLLLRRSARPGDAVMVTGLLGGAAAGLALLQHGDPLAPAFGGLDPADRFMVIARQLTPEPRLAVAPLLGPLGAHGRALAEAGAHAAIDVSDGLAADAGHICAQSRVGMRIEAARLPIDPAAARVGEAMGLDVFAWALAGGEDYELLFTADPLRADALARAVTNATGISVTAIGVVTADPARTLVLADGRSVPLAGGWRHFGNDASSGESESTYAQPR